ncbi:hypothetical protein HHI36_002170 [Cryptolaemus montrouzieri]|uniref:Amine oxidase domain-containing protein n=1 Tax=Cryptolaemus montrouzieri TaxID=559131 RepID=A0ABD2PAM5_9CUCU
MWKFLFCFLFIRYGTGEKIIIIGAGSSGIAAASKLLSHNISDFRILEAEDRIGGRIHSIHLGSAYVDLGAQYVHGMKNNLAYELAHNFVIPGNELNYTWMYYNGKRRVDDNLLNTLWDLTPETYEDGGSNVSVGDAFLSRYNSTVFNQYKNDTQMLTFAKDFIRICECSILGLEGSFSWFKPIATSSFQDCDGPNTLSWNGLGYKTILDLLLKNFPNKTGYDITNNLSLNTTVTKIIMEENSVKVKCADDSEYNTEYVLWTPSLGVLKHDHKSIFQPKLSDERINAIENFGFDGVMKIVFEFPNNWWGEEKYFWFVWNEKDKDDVIKDVSFGPVKLSDICHIFRTTVRILSQISV